MRPSGRPTGTRRPRNAFPRAARPCPATCRPPPRVGRARRLLFAQSRAWVKRQRPHASLGGGAGKPRAASRHPAAGLRRTMRCLGGYHFAFDTGPRFGLCYASLPLDNGRACLQPVRTLLAGKRCVWCHARHQWRRQGKDGRRRAPSGRSGRCRPAWSRRACRGWRRQGTRRGTRRRGVG
jgi:hypothetical protein